MNVRMKVEISGIRDGKPWPRRGEAIDMPEDEAAGYVAAGMAELADEPDEPDESDKGADETADADTSSVEKAVRGRAPRSGAK